MLLRWNAAFRKRGPYQWQAQVWEKGHPLQTKTFDTRTAAETWARAEVTPHRDWMREMNRHHHPMTDLSVE